MKQHQKTHLARHEWGPEWGTAPQTRQTGDAKPKLALLDEATEARWNGLDAGLSRGV